MPLEIALAGRRCTRNMMMKMTYAGMKSRRMAEGHSVASSARAIITATSKMTIIITTITTTTELGAVGA